MTKYAIILCAGSASRAGLGFNKILYPLGRKNVLETVLDKFEDFDKIIVTASEKDIPEIKTLCKGLSFADKVIVIQGGDTRTQSVKNGLAAAAGCTVAAIHDAARPFVSRALIKAVVASAIETGSGVPAVKVIDSIKEVASEYCSCALSSASLPFVSKTLNRDNLAAAQTPQAFNYQKIKAAYDTVTGAHEDDSEVYRLAGHSPVIVPGEYTNKKLTTPADFFPTHSTVGTGFDVHELTENRKLIIGGIEVPHTKGLLGHSDADVLTHAVMDALLSAAGQRDIGGLFPDSDSKYKNADSIELLKHVVSLLKSSSIKIDFISAVIIAQEPKMAPHMDAIRLSLSTALQISKEKINISATTTEFMGIVGNGKAIAASATCLCSFK